MKYWFAIHLLFLIFYIVFMIYKINSGSGKVNPLDGKAEITGVFNLPLFLGMIIGFVCMTGALLLKNITWPLRVLLLASGYVLSSFGFIKTLDPDLDWENGDVPWGNYDAAREVNQFGALYVIKTWNDRSNPSLESPFQEVNDSVAGLMRTFKLDWLTFNKWDNTAYPEGLGKENNRPYMHPPFVPVFLAYWLKLFPYGQWSAEFLMILLSLFSLLCIVIVFRKNIFSVNADIMLLLALFTTPVMIIFPNPSAEQLPGILFILSALMMIKPGKRATLSFFGAGLLIGLSFYTKFNIIFYIALQLAYLLIRHKLFGIKQLLAYASGLLLVFMAFTLSGYYFWLTFVTGFVYTKIYAADNPVGLLLGLSKIIYFGPALLLIILLYITDIKSQWERNNPVLIPSLLSLVVLSLYLWDQGTWNRYLTFYLPVISLFLIPYLRKFEFKTKDLLIVPVVNLTFLFLSLYF